MGAHAFDPLAELIALEGADGFVARHVAPAKSDVAAMLYQVGASSLETVSGMAKLLWTPPDAAA